MATYTFTVFLLIGFLLTRVLVPKKKAQAWLYSILIPIGLLILTVAIFGKGIPFVMGQVIGGSFVATIATIILMSIILISKYNKSKNDNNLQ